MKEVVHGEIEAPYGGDPELQPAVPELLDKIASDVLNDYGIQIMNINFEVVDGAKVLKWYRETHPKGVN